MGENKMGSVQSDIECKYPNAMEDYYYKSDELYIFCRNCGFSYSRTIRRDDDGKLILKCPGEKVTKMMKKVELDYKNSLLSELSEDEKKQQFKELGVKHKKIGETSV